MGLVGMGEAEAAERFKAALAALNSGDLQQGTAALEELAAQGYDLAQFSLGFLYQNGVGVAQDDEKAAYWFQQAAEQGQAEARSAQEALAQSQKAAVSREEALKAKLANMQAQTEKAAEQENANAQRQLLRLRGDRS